MRVTWILSSSNLDADGTTSPLASYRYRALVPMRELSARGHACRVHPVKPNDPPIEALRDSDVAVFGKNHSEPNEMIALLDHARSNGIATVVDLCDDYFGTGNALEPYYRALIQRADLVTASSHQLAFAIEDATDADALVVRDPYEGPAGIPRWAPSSQRIRALWFGTPLNLESLLTEALSWPAKLRRSKLDLTVLTRACEGLEASLAQLSERSGGQLDMRFAEWSLQRNWAALAACDLVLIPVKRGDRFAHAKGPNRLVEALRAGRYAIVGSIPAYEEFSAFATVTDDIAGGVDWAVDHPQEVVERIEAGRRHVERYYSPAAIALEWEQALGAALRRSSAGANGA